MSPPAQPRGTSQGLNQALTRHREEAAQPLQIHVPVECLVDQGRCDSLRQDIVDWCDGDGWECKIATPTLGRSLPARPGLYMFVWRPPVVFDLAPPLDNQTMWFVLYVGMAGPGTLKSRYTSEYQKHVGQDPENLWPPAEPKNRDSRLKCFLNLENLEYWYVLINDESRIQKAEKRLIRILNPPLNIQGKTRRLRKHHTEPAF